MKPNCLYKTSNSSNGNEWQFDDCRCFYPYKTINSNLNDRKSAKKWRISTTAIAPLLRRGKEAVTTALLPPSYRLNARRLPLLDFKKQFN